MEKRNRKLTKYLLVLYLILLVWVVIFKCGIPKEIMGNLYTNDPIGFGPAIAKYMDLNLYERFTYDFFLLDGVDEIVKNVFLNILVFLPFGLLISLLINNHKMVMTIVISFITSLLFEIFQLFTSFGCFSFIDLLCNVIGGILGVLVYLFLMRIVTKENTNKVIYRTCIISFVIFIPVLIFACIYTGINFEYIIYRFSYHF